MQARARSRTDRLPTTNGRARVRNGESPQARAITSGPTPATSPIVSATSGRSSRHVHRVTPSEIGSMRRDRAGRSVDRARDASAIARPAVVAPAGRRGRSTVARRPARLARGPAASPQPATRRTRPPSDAPHASIASIGRRPIVPIVRVRTDHYRRAGPRGVEPTSAAGRTGYSAGRSVLESIRGVRSRGRPAAAVRPRRVPTSPRGRDRC